MNQNEIIVRDELLSSGFTKEATAAIMGIVAGESNFKSLKEKSYANTSNNRIRAIFPSRLGKMSDDELNSLKKDYDAFFNAVYGGMYGNAPDEGAKYVGRGANGITFKHNYKVISDALGIDFITNPELLEQIEYAAKALTIYFKSIKGINDIEQAFKKAYVLNAGIGKSFDYYASSGNPVHKVGIKLKREKAIKYYNMI